MGDKTGTIRRVLGAADEPNAQSNIAKNLETITNYASTSSNPGNFTIRKSNSLETVWAFDNTAFDLKPTKSTSSVVNEYGIPNPLQTTHQKDDYDPYQNSTPESPTTFSGTVLHLFMISSGPAILTIPISFLEVGWVLGFFSTVLIIWFYAYNIHMLVWSEYQICKSKHVPTMTYSQVVYHAFNDGPKWTRKFSSFASSLIQIALILLWMSGCCYNLVAISENMQTVWNSGTGGNISRQVVMLWIFIPVLLLSWIRKLSYLVPFSIFGNILNLVCVVVIVFDIFFNGLPFNGAPPFGSLPNLTLFLGSVLFTINATGIMLPLRSDMKQPRRFDGISGALGVTFLPVSFLFAFFSLFCSLKYGQDLKDSVIQNLEENATFARIMVLFSSLSLMAQYPLISFVVFDVIWNNLLNTYRKTWTNLLVAEIVLKTIINLIALLCAISVPNVALFLTLGGSVFTALDSIMFPAALQTLVMWNMNNNKEKLNRIFIKNSIIILFAVVLVIAGLIQSTSNIIQYYSTGVEQ